MGLRDWAAEHGFALTTDWNFQPFGMTDDALTITGYAIRTSDLAWSPFVLDLRPTPQPCPAGLGGDGAEGAQDLAVLLSAWGACP